MNSTFKLKLIQALNKKNANKGFTLIELLVVVIMIGVLASISFPVLIRQVGRARQVEARNNLGIVNRAQQAFRLENPTFATVANLPINNTPGSYYTSVVSEGTPNATFAAHSIAALTNYTEDIPDYSSAVAQNTAGVFSAIICETNDPTAAAVVVPTSTTSCLAGSRRVGL
ncbi:prepilin-type N-terminal cleavage/methylation domain-containing protein [Microcystis aeruginosa NIES-298]|uniref:Pilin polypeptide PilA n=1 Tax=Microcystis aeruginosa NIES-298 TaxID=449468 RepID=A0A2H6BNX0_MICAE|nr:type IV pilin-like G/H family protein [Microcystis aeruginosa]QHU82206.1 prepilin-type N-terminal cleavage/methylation domain-containing protein [Microcystis aeruginosa NIES-298]GBD51887.1 pilin polypeptide PilA [Microcystis aeruginosa NIES-298]GBE98978.1 pili assembly chaperone [Microcystis aeruginosa NIES-298]